MAFYRARIFPLLAGLLWAAFLFLDLTGLSDSAWVKYAAVCLCCMTALFGAKTTDGRVVAAAMCFTAAADWFLLVRNDNYELGVGLFIVVQLLYAYRLYLLRDNTFSRLGLLRLPALLSLLGPALGLYGWLYALAPIYFLNLCVNCAEAFALKAKGPVRRFRWGLLLFVGCDLCVGLWNLGPLPSQWLTEFARVGMWLFYLPSQVLIVLSQSAKGDPL